MIRLPQSRGDGQPVSVNLMILRREVLLLVGVLRGKTGVIRAELVINNEWSHVRSYYLKLETKLKTNSS
jgi:hypothetical protein